VASRDDHTALGPGAGGLWTEERKERSDRSGEGRGHLAGPGARAGEGRRRYHGQWRDTLRDAADLALVGIAVTIASLPVLTAGAAVATASAAIHERYAEGRWPDLADNARRYLRAILPGIPVTLTGLVVVALLVLDVWAIRTGAVPGGTGLLLATSTVGFGVVGLLGLTVVAVGRAGGTGWWPALRTAFQYAQRHPLTALAAGAVVGLAVLLALSIPFTGPILVGYALVGLHAVARRAGAPPPPGSPLEK